MSHTQAHAHHGGTLLFHVDLLSTVNIIYSAHLFCLSPSASVSKLPPELCTTFGVSHIHTHTFSDITMLCVRSNRANDYAIPQLIKI